MTLPDTPYAIWWEDSATPCRDGWTHLSGAPMSPPIIVSVGFIVDRGPDSITLANTLDPADNSVCGRICIPTSAIRKKRILDLK